MGEKDTVGQWMRILLSVVWAKKILLFGGCKYCCLMDERKRYCWSMDAKSRLESVVSQAEGKTGVFRQRNSVKKALLAR